MKKITLTLNLEDMRIINEDDEFEDIKDEMLTDMYDYMSNMSFGAFCNMCDIELEVEEWKIQLKKEFQDKVNVIDYLVNEYKNEIQRTYEGWDNKTYRSTRKSRLKRIRLELDELLKDIENNYGSGYYNEVE